MKRFQITIALGVIILALLSFKNKTSLKNTKMKEAFIEITVQSHIILHGFDEHNKEIIEEVKVDKPVKKFIAISRVLSVSEKYILTNYAFGRLVYWEYIGDYEELKEKLILNSDSVD